MAAVPMYVYAVFGLLFIAMGGWIFNRARQNRIRMMEENMPAIAGSDVVAGVATDTGQFDEPDEDALDQMEELLDDAAESQGLTYSE